MSVFAEKLINYLDFTRKAEERKKGKRPMLLGLGRYV